MARIRVDWTVTKHMLPPMGGKHHVVEVTGQPAIPGGRSVTRAGVGVTYDKAVTNAKNLINKQIRHQVEAMEAERKAKDDKRRRR